MLILNTRKKYIYILYKTSYLFNKCEVFYITKITIIYGRDFTQKTLSNVLRHKIAVITILSKHLHILRMASSRMLRRVALV
jgi:hypothetical protein